MVQLHQRSLLISLKVYLSIVEGAPFDILKAVIMGSDNQSAFLSTDLEIRGTSNPIAERSRVYFDIQIGNKKEGRVTFQLVRTLSKSVRTEGARAMPLITQN